MCYSISFLEKKISKLAARYQTLLPLRWREQLDSGLLTKELPAYYFVSGFVHPQLPLVTHDGIRLSSWGLIPHWAKNREVAEKLRNGTLNAVGETVFEKPSFRKSILSRRCVLGVNGFFEWREFNNIKYPYFIYPSNDDMFSLGCVYDQWTDKGTGEIICTFSIITTPANALMAQIHNRRKRMPLIIPSKAIQCWISPGASGEDVAGMICPIDQSHMQAHAVTRSLNYSRKERNTPEAIQAMDYPELPPLPVA